MEHKRFSWMLIRIRLAILVMAFFPEFALNAQVLSQWRGPERNGVYPESNLLTSWPEEGPTLLWSTGGLGKGFASAAITADAIYVQE